MDESLPLAYRFRALCNYNQMTQPIGFHATWSYLEAKLGIPRPAVEFLTPAIGMLRSQQIAHAQVVADYAAIRTGEKHAGRRSPPRDEAVPRFPRSWHGDEREGARHVLRQLLARRDDPFYAHPYGSLLIADVKAALDSPHIPRMGDEELQAILEYARRRYFVIGPHAEPYPFQMGSEYQMSWRLLCWLSQIYVLDKGAPGVGTPWHFVPPLNRSPPLPVPHRGGGD